MRKIPKYRPLKRPSRPVGKRERSIGITAVVIILGLMACGVVALTLTGIFEPIGIITPLTEVPEDALNIQPPPTPRSFMPREQTAAASYVVASSGGTGNKTGGKVSGKVSGVSQQQREEINEKTILENLQAYGEITDEWDTEQILALINDLPTFFVKDDSKVTVRSSELSPNKNLPVEWTNILLLGTDDRDAKSSAGRTDVMIIASLNASTGEMKLTSLARDMLLDIPLIGLQRFNTAHAYGGPNLAMKAVNELFDMNITKYARVNLHGLYDIINVFGGVVIELQPGEADEINYNVAVSEDYEGFEKNPDRVRIPSDKVGMTKLDALQALGYARIRHIDSDFNRTNRQRVLLDTLLAMAMDEASPLKIFLVANVMIPYTTTNLSLSEIVSIGADMLGSGLQPMQSESIPIPGSFSYIQTENGESVLDIRLKANRDALHTFIYGGVYPR